MKKLLAVLLCLSMLLAFAACGKGTQTQTTTKKTTEVSTTLTYKDTLVSYDKLDPAPRIVCFQNALGTSDMDEFGLGAAKAETAGSYAKAYSVSCCTRYFTEKVTGDVTVYDTALKKTVISADKFTAGYIAMADDGSGVFITGSTVVKNLKYIVDSAGEAIIFVPKSTTLVCGDMLTEMGLSTTAKTYRFVAVDKFYNSEGPDIMKTSEIRGTLSGAVNCSVDNGQGYGKINDFLFMEIVA